MPSKTDRLRKAVKKVARRTGEAIRQVDKKVKKKIRRRRVRRAAQAAGEVALVQGTAVLAGAAADEVVRRLARRRSRRQAQTVGFEVALHLPVEAAIAQVTDMLRVEGFGILTRIDVHTTLREKMGASFRPFVILGACHPALAYRALSARPEAGLLLPCNVTVEERPAGGSTIRIANPEALLEAGGLSNDRELRAVAAEATERMRHAIDMLAGHAERVVL